MKTFKIEMYGYGGEIVLGTITKEAYEHWADRDEEDEGRHHHLFWDPYEEQEGNDVIDDDDPRFLGMWHEIDDITHTHGAFYDRCTVEVIDEDDKTIWEQEPMETLAKDGQMSALVHKGFWHPMDTLRDKKYLEDLWISGKAPWKKW